MNLHIDYSLAAHYKSRPQMMRVATEAWVAKNMYCPICGQAMLEHLPANSPVATLNATSAATSLN